MNPFIILIVFSVLLISFLQSILMIAASEYIQKTENYFINKNINYLKYIRLNFKKLVKSILAKKENKINGTVFVTNCITLILLTIPICLIIVKSFFIEISLHENFLTNIQSFYIVYASLIVLTARLINYISSNYQIDINKMVLKGFVSLALVVLNFSFVNYFIVHIEVFGQNKLIVKIILFFTTVISIYLFDNYTKYKKKKTNYQNKLLDKVDLYFILLGSFLLLNNNAREEIQFVKFIYYSISIYLIDFLAAYVTKTIGHVKMFQIIRVSYEYIFIYFLVLYLIMLVVGHGI